MMLEFELLLKELQILIRENTYVEDSNLYIKSKLKYDVFNLMERLDKKFIDELIKDLKVIDD